jgi:hypothetical protein
LKCKKLERECKETLRTKACVEAERALFKERVSVLTRINRDLEMKNFMLEA